MTAWADKNITKTLMHIKLSDKKQNLIHISANFFRISPYKM